MNNMAETALQHQKAHRFHRNTIAEKNRKSYRVGTHETVDKYLPCVIFEAGLSNSLAIYNRHYCPTLGHTN